MRKETTMKTFSVLITVLMVAIFSSWVAAQNEMPNDIRGEALYEQHCLRCHGRSGDGNGPDSKFLIVPPANFQSDASRNKSEWEMLRIISYGIIFSPMHGWHDRLTDEEMLDVLSYIRKMLSLKASRRGGRINGKI
jgi:mono/diheme cytochrome c family protein